MILSLYYCQMLVILLCLVSVSSAWNQRSTSWQLRAHSRLYMQDVAANPTSISVVLLAGGKGKRMQSATPKQFLPLLGKPVFLRSLEIFQSMKEVTNIIIVLDETFRNEYQAFVRSDPRISWANPGAERQDSVYNGLLKTPETSSIVAIHDAARPLVTVEEVRKCLQDAFKHGAAVLGVPCKATIKESEDGQFVLRTMQRSRLWEIHTPQVARRELFLQGFEKVQKEKLEVTDDVSVIEALGKPIKLTLGEYTNIKLTTPDDMQVAEQILRERGVEMYVAPPKPLPGEKELYACPSEQYRESLEKAAFLRAKGINAQGA
jgi:2-C-methyl-D-erythritol 4-phosphate cytidylyltransferase